MQYSVITKVLLIEKKKSLYEKLAVWEVFAMEYNTIVNF